MPATPKRAGRTPKPGSKFLGEVVADNVRGQRSQRRLSQDSLAERIGWLGHSWSRATVSEVERNERTVTLDEFLALALVLGTRPDQLLLPQRGRVDVGGNLAPVNANFLESWLTGRIDAEANPEDGGESIIVSTVEQEWREDRTPSTPEEIKRFFGPAVNRVED